MKQGWRRSGPFIAALALLGSTIVEVSTTVAQPKRADDLRAAIEGLIGSWDGAHYVNDGRMVYHQVKQAGIVDIAPVSATFRRSTERDRLLEAEFAWRGTILKASLRLDPRPRRDREPPLGPANQPQGGGKFALVAESAWGGASPGTPIGTLALKPARAANEWEVSGDLRAPDRQGTGMLALRRRPSGSPGLDQICDEAVTPWVRERMKAREIARSLKAMFFPALAEYRPSSAGSIEAISRFEKVTARLVFECVVTWRTNTKNTGYDPFLLDLFSQDTIKDGMYELAANSEFRRPLDYPQIDFEASLVKERAVDAEKLLAAVLVDADELSTTAEILGFVARNSDLIGRARPSVALERLQPLSRALDNAVGHDDQAAQEKLARSASQRMSGVPLPALNVQTERRQFISDVANGRRVEMSAANVRFLTGALDAWSTSCGKPDPRLRARLSSLYRLGAESTVFIDYRPGSTLADAFSGPASAAVDLADGQMFLKALAAIIPSCSHSSSRSPTCRVAPRARATSSGPALSTCLRPRAPASANMSAPPMPRPASRATSSRQTRSSSCRLAGS